MLAEIGGRERAKSIRKKIVVLRGKLKRAKAYPAGIQSRRLRAITRDATIVLFPIPLRNAGTSPSPPAETDDALITPSAIR